MNKTIYLSLTGMLEPLGQSQVLSYLFGLSREFEVTLISFERDEHLREADEVARIEELCDAHRIRWVRRRFLRRPRIVASAINLMSFFFITWREAHRSGARLIHARSYIPAAAAWAVSRLTGIPYIFDMRALWPEEYIASGRLKRGSAIHRAILAAERACLRDAAAVVSLTHAAVDYLRQAYPDELKSQKVVVIPTCADVDRFTPAEVRRSGPRVYACIGTLLSGWFRTDWLAALFGAAARRDPLAQFEVITRDDPREVRLAIDPTGALGPRLRIDARLPQEMPDAVREHDVSVMFFTEGLSKLGSSPTRMGEVLACGLPVLVNRGVGDVERIVMEHRVGILVASSARADMIAALDALDALMGDPELPERCRRAAESVYALDNGTRKYAEIYHRLVERKAEATRSSIDTPSVARRKPIEQK